MKHKYLFILILGLLLCCKDHNLNYFEKTISRIISVDDEHIYYENVGGIITKKNSKTDKKIWEHKKLYDISIKCFDTESSIFYTTPNKVVSINKTNGKVNFILDETFTTRTYDFISYEEEIIALSEYGAYSFSMSSGKILWTLLPESKTILCNPKAIIYDDTIFIAGNFKSHIVSTLFAYTMKDKTKINHLDISKDIITNIVISDNDLIFGTGQSIMAREIYSINKDNFKINWQLKQNIDYSSKILTQNNEFIYFNFKNQVFELNTKSLEIIERYKLPNNYYQLFEIFDDKIFAFDNSSFTTYSLENNETKRYNNVMTAGIWKIDGKIYYANKTEIKQINGI